MTEWISVEDRSPEKEGRYIVCEHSPKIWVGVGFYCKVMRQWETKNITHWMPLPSPPEK